MEKTIRMGKERIGKLVFEFSSPAITGLMISGLYNIVSAIMIGRGVGAEALSGMTVSFVMSIVIMAFGMLSGMGAVSLTSIKLGEGKKEEAEWMVGNGLSLGIIIAFFLTITGRIFLEPILGAFGAKGESLQYAKEYSGILILGTVFQIIVYTMNNLIRAEGNPPMALSTNIIGFILFLISAWAYIFLFKLGIKGAPLGIMTAQIITCIWTTLYFRGKKSTLKLRWKKMALRKEIVLKIVSIGIAPASVQLLSGVLLITINHMVAVYGGDNAIAAMGVAFSIYNFFLMPLVGINQGIQPVIGYNYGAKLFSRVKNTLNSGIAIATVFCIAGFIAIFFFNEGIMSAFAVDNPEIQKTGAHGLKLFLCMLPVIGFQMVSTSYYQAAGKPKQAVFLGLLKPVILMIPLLFILPLFYKLDGVWMSGPVSDIIAAAVTALFLFTEYRHLDKKNLPVKPSLSVQNEILVE